MKKGIFHQMTDFVEVFTVFSLFLTVLFKWNDYLHSLLSGLINNNITVIASINKKILGFYSFDQI